MGNPKVAIAVVRASTEIQANTAEIQVRAMHEYADAHGIKIAAVFEEIGFSGGLPIERRPILLAAIAALPDHDAGVLLFAERTRISRDATTSALIRLATERAGARLVTAAQGEATDPASELLAGILDHVSQFERALIRGRIQAAMDTKRAKGERLGQIPFGQRVAADGKTLEPDPTEQDIIARVRAWSAEGLSQRNIVAALEHEGIPSPRTGAVRWHKTTVAKMLQK